MAIKNIQNIQTLNNYNASPAKFNFKKYDSNTSTYYNNSQNIDFVTWDGNLYVCIKNEASYKQGGPSNDDFLLLVSKGTDGRNGLDGTTGPIGPMPNLTARFSGKQLQIFNNEGRIAVSEDLTGPTWKPIRSGDKISWTLEEGTPSDIDLKDLHSIEERPLLLRVDSDNTKRSNEKSGPARLIQWKREGEENWHNLMSIAELMKLAFVGISFWTGEDGFFHFGYREVKEASYESDSEGREIISSIDLGNVLFDIGRIPFVSYEFDFDQVNQKIENLRQLLNGLRIENGQYLTENDLKRLGEYSLVGEGTINLKTINDQSLFGTEPIRITPSSIGAFTKEESNNRFQPKGSYIETINGNPPINGNINLNYQPKGRYVTKINNIYTPGDDGNVNIPLGGPGVSSGETIRPFTLYQRNNIPGNSDTKPTTPENSTFTWDGTSSFLVDTSENSEWLNYPENQNTSNNKVYLWMTSAMYSSLNGIIHEDDESGWSTPICLTAEGGKDGIDGDYQEFVYKLTKTNVAPNLYENYGCVPVHIPGLNKTLYLFKNSSAYKDFLPASQASIIFNPITTTDPISVDPNINPNNPNTSTNTTIDSWNGWTDDPTGISEEYPYEWVSTRTITYDSNNNPVFGPFSTPVIWSKWGVNGVDGAGVEYIYYRTGNSTLSYTENPANLHSSVINSVEYQNATLEYIPRAINQPLLKNGTRFAADWTDNPSGVNADYPYEFVSCRKRRYNNATPSEMKWTEFSEPSLWAHYGKDGNAIVSNYVIVPLSTTVTARNEREVNGKKVYDVSGTLTWNLSNNGQIVYGNLCTVSIGNHTVYNSISNSTYTTDINVTETSDLFLHIKWYLGTSLSDKVVDSAIVPVLLAGPQGTPGESRVQGLDGVIMRLSNWVAGVNYYDGSEPDDNGITYQDVVFYDNEYYKCVSCHESNEANKPVNNGQLNAHWEYMTFVGDAAFETLISKSAYIRDLTSKQIVVTNSDDVVVGGMTSSSSVAIADTNDRSHNVGNIRIWAGPISGNGNLENAPFTVDDRGVLHATKGYFGGENGIVIDENTGKITFGSDVDITAENSGYSIAVLKCSIIATPVSNNTYNLNNGEIVFELYENGNKINTDNSNNVIVQLEGNNVYKTFNNGQYKVQPSGIVGLTEEQLFINIIWKSENDTVKSRIIVPFTIRGQQGEPGTNTTQSITGNVMRLRNWTANTEYYDGVNLTIGSAAENIPYLDVVVVENDNKTNYYKCIYSHKSGSAFNKDEKISNNSLWKEFALIGDAAFSDLISESGFIENLTSHQVIIKDNNKIVAGMISSSGIPTEDDIDDNLIGNVRIWAGELPSNGDVTETAFNITDEGVVTSQGTIDTDNDNEDDVALRTVMDNGLINIDVKDLTAVSPAWKTKARFGYVDGDIVLEFLDENNNPIYNLGPSGIQQLNSFVILPEYDPVKFWRFSTGFSANSNYVQADGTENILYQYKDGKRESILGGTAIEYYDPDRRNYYGTHSVYNGKYYATTRLTYPLIDGYYVIDSTKWIRRGINNDEANCTILHVYTSNGIKICEEAQLKLMNVDQNAGTTGIVESVGSWVQY